MNINIKRNKGITLIALVITIIILLILAGITLMALTGDNGLFTRAKEAKELNEKASDKERIQLEVLGSYDENGNLNFETVKSNINKNIQDSTVSGDDFPIVVILNGNTFEINSDGAVNLKELTPSIYEVKVVANSDGIGTEDDLKAYSQTELIDLYISFKAEISDGTIKSVTCNDGIVEKKGDLYVTKITKNGSYQFTIVGTVNNEDYTLRNYSVVVDKYSKRLGIKVGDYVDYTPDTSTNSSYPLLSKYSGATSDQEIQRENLSWRVLKIYDDGQVDLLGDVTNSEVSLGGALGYNNGVLLLNDICKNLYGRDNVEARSINIVDIKEYFTQSGNYAMNQYKAASYRYGDNPGYTNVTSKMRYFPFIDYNRSMVLDEVEPILDELMESKYMYKGSTFSCLNNAFKLKISDVNVKLKELFVSNDIYWVASRMRIASLPAEFGLHCVGEEINYYILCNSSEAEFGDSTFYRLRPIVKLDENVDIILSSEENNSEHPHEIDWKDN